MTFCNCATATHRLSGEGQQQTLSMNEAVSTALRQRAAQQHLQQAVVQALPAAMAEYEQAAAALRTRVARAGASVKVCLTVLKATGDDDQKTALASALKQIKGGTVRGPQVGHAFGLLLHC